jgi:purine nucleosidase
MLKGLVIMGGDFSSDRPSAEWNIRCDPHAAAMVFRAHFPSVRVVGLDITRSVSLTKEEVRAQFAAPLLEPVLDYADIWFREHDTLIFHDPLTAATIFEESLCSFTRGHVEVSLDSICEPFTSWKPDDARGPHEVARSVDRCRYFEHLSRVLQAGPNSPPR